MEIKYCRSDRISSLWRGCKSWYPSRYQANLIEARSPESSDLGSSPVHGKTVGYHKDRLMTADLLSAIELELMRLKIKPGKYYRLRTGHLIRLLDLCEFIPEMKRIVDGIFFRCYIGRLCEILGREIRLVNRLALGNMICILDLENLRRISELLQKELPAAPGPIKPVKTKAPHRPWAARWFNNRLIAKIKRWRIVHADFLNTLPGVLFVVLTTIMMLVSEIKL